MLLTKRVQIQIQLTTKTVYREDIQRVKTIFMHQIINLNLYHLKDHFLANPRSPQPWDIFNVGMHAGSAKIVVVAESMANRSDDDYLLGSLLQPVDQGNQSILGLHMLLHMPLLQQGNLKLSIMYLSLETYMVAFYILESYGIIKLYKTCLILDIKR